MFREIGVILPPIVSIFTRRVDSVKRKELTSLAAESGIVFNEINQLDLFLDLCKKTKPVLSDKFKWSGKKANPYQFTAFSLDFLDQHSGLIPIDLLPPKEDFNNFSNIIMSFTQPAKLCEQFNIAINIVNGDLLSAAFLCQVVNRFYGRGLDTRGYPDIHIDWCVMKKWKDRIAGFDTKNRSNRLPDPVACTYYFFTALTASLMLNSKDDNESYALRFIYSKAPKLMDFARSSCANQPSIGDYEKIYESGWEIGKVIVKNFDP